jgi:hypothetical protein
MCSPAAAGAGHRIATADVLIFAAFRRDHLDDAVGHPVRYFFENWLNDDISVGALADPRRRDRVGRAGA